MNFARTSAILASASMIGWVAPVLAQDGEERTDDIIVTAQQ